jgi:hypothetical protein
MLIGDSHSDAIKTSFTQEANRAGFRVVFPVSNDVLASAQLDEKWLLKAAQEHKVRHVFLHFSLANIRPAIIERTRALLWQNGITTSTIMPVPTREQIIPQILLRAHQRGVAPEPMPVADYEKEIVQVAAPLRVPRAGYQVIETKAALCTPDCRIQTQDGHPLYFDKHHLTLTGAQLLSPILRQAIEAMPDAS